MIDDLTLFSSLKSTGIGGNVFGALKYVWSFEVCRTAPVPGSDGTFYGDAIFSQTLDTAT